jgi:hypothetical protein
MECSRTTGMTCFCCLQSVSDGSCLAYDVSGNNGQVYRVQMIRLPSRYEDLDTAFRGRLRPVSPLLALVKRAYQQMQVSGGIRFLPIYGKSGSGKTCAAQELSTHLPASIVKALSRQEIESSEALNQCLGWHITQQETATKLLIFVIDQFEEAVADQAGLAAAFVERIALLDRNDFRRYPMLFVWLTTRKDFQESLAAATSRNQRILLARDFELLGPSKEEWPGIIEDTFQFHNNERSLADLDVLQDNLQDISRGTETIGAALEQVGMLASADHPGLQDLSVYQVVMIWPVTDGQRIARFQQFTDARQGYKLDWGSWYRQLNADDQRQLSRALHGLNRARLYFDLRVVPIAAADLHAIGRNLESNDELARTVLDRFQKTHFFSVVSGKWNPDAYAPMRERESDRASAARDWYEKVSSEPHALGRCLAKALRESGVPAETEQSISTSHGTVVADILAHRQIAQPEVAIELKAFAADRTMPSTICEQIRVTLRKYAHMAGFLERQ